MSMRRGNNGTTGESVPDFFCWSKFGTEAGERTSSIFRRKEIERRKNSGTFLWGIGNSIQPSFADLLNLTDEPEVLFSPIKGRPSKRDVAPAELIVWCAAVGLDGRPYQIPNFSVVTSGRNPGNPKSTHFALVCESENSLLDEPQPANHVTMDGVRNLKSGSPLGGSQVTSIVRRVAPPTNGHRYPVTARARLAHPYILTLSKGVAVPDHKRFDFAAAGDDFFESMHNELLKIRRA